MTKHKYRLLLVLWCILIFALSSIPSAKFSEQDRLDTIIRKSGHIFEYFVLYILSYKSFNNNHKVAFVFSVIYAASDEFHQRFTPGRGPSIRDVFIDTIGITIGFIFIWKGYLAKTKKKILKLQKKY